MKISLRHPEVWFTAPDDVLDLRRVNVILAATYVILGERHIQAIIVFEHLAELKISFKIRKGASQSKNGIVT